MKATQVEKIVRYMARNPEQEWFYAPDFQQRNMDEDVFVGYEASARMSDIMRDYPGLIEVKRDGKYRYIKLCSDMRVFSNPMIPDILKEIIKQERSKQTPPPRAVNVGLERK